MDHLTLTLQNFLQQKTFKIAQMNGDHTAHMTPENRVGHADTSADAHHPHMLDLYEYMRRICRINGYSATAWPTLLVCAKKD